MATGTWGTRRIGLERAKKRKHLQVLSQRLHNACRHAARGILLAAQQLVDALRGPRSAGQH